MEDGCMVTKDKLKELLQEGPVTVTFLKKDGTERTMRCTTNVKDFLPSPNVVPDAPKTPRKVNPNQVRVWDLDKEAWRSFNYESVTSVDVSELTALDDVTKVLCGVSLIGGLTYGASYLLH